MSLRATMIRISLVSAAFRRAGAIVLLVTTAAVPLKDEIALPEMLATELPKPQMTEISPAENPLKELLQSASLGSLALDSLGKVQVAFTGQVRSAKERSFSRSNHGYWELREVRRTADGSWENAKNVLASRLARRINDGCSA